MEPSIISVTLSVANAGTQLRIISTVSNHAAARLKLVFIAILLFPHSKWLRGYSAAVASAGSSAGASSAAAAVMVTPARHCQAAFSSHTMKEMTGAPS